MDAIFKVNVKVGVIIENQDGEILLIKEKVDKNSPLAWNIVKGTYEITDGRIEECAKRECREEVGLDVGILGIHSIMFFRQKNGLKIQCNFIAKPLNKNVTLPRNRNVMIKGEDIQVLKWMKPKDIALLKPNDFVANYTLSIIKSWFDTKKIHPLDLFQYFH
jgi:ADP-ribose pyrophosphatase YjhB (NUDIX family)